MTDDSDSSLYLMSHTNQQPTLVPRRRRKHPFAPVEFNFVSPFTPEECIYRLEQDVQSGGSFPILIESVDVNTYTFRIVDFYIRGTDIRMEVSGQLKLWGETSTLITGKSQIPRSYRLLISILSFLAVPIFATLGTALIWQRGSDSGALSGLILFVLCLYLMYIAQCVILDRARMELIDQIENAVAVKSVKPKRLKKK
jgi:hypothetical protein